jgi:hypothetical protein
MAATADRRTVPVTDADYAALCECRCPRLPGTHLAGHCADTTPGQDTSARGERR